MDNRERKARTMLAVLGDFLQKPLAECDVLNVGGPAGIRLMWNKPHYDLPLLAILPRPLVHVYIRLARKADYYHEKLLTYWNLKKLVRNFDRSDYTVRLINESDRFLTEYMLPAVLPPWHFPSEASSMRLRPSCLTQNR